MVLQCDLQFCHLWREMLTQNPEDHLWVFRMLDLTTIYQGCLHIITKHGDELFSLIVQFKVCGLVECLVGILDEI